MSYPASLVSAFFGIQVLSNSAGAPPIEGATVSVTLLYAAGGVPAGTVYSAQTDAYGTAYFNAIEGAYGIQITKAGFVTYTNARVNFGDGGGFIAALDPITNPPPPPPSFNWGGVIIAGAVALVAIMLISGEKK